MPDVTTENLDLILPEVGGSDDSWGGKLNDNLSAIDAAVGAAVRAPDGPIASLETVANRAGKLFVFDADGDPDVAVFDDSADGSLRADLAASGGSALSGFLLNGTGPSSRSVQARLRDSVSLKDFEPNAGTGNTTTDQSAFSKACIWLMAQRRQVAINAATFAGYVYPSASVFIPPGDYSLAGNLGSGLGLLSFWAIPGTVTIKLTGSSPLFTIPNRLENTYVSGLWIIGGGGLLNHTYTGNNVALKHIIQDCLFIDYEGCAIASNAQDMPYWHILRNTFFCLAGSATLCKGVAIGGLNDGGVIDSNSFNRNDIHLQIGPMNSGNMIVSNNDFLSFENNRTDYDVWLIPADVVGGYDTNAGQTTRFVGNKWGNEGITSFSKKAPRVLVAAKGAGLRGVAEPDLTWKDGSNGANWLIGVTFEENRIVAAQLGGTEGPDASFANIWCEKVDRIVFKNNDISGGRYNYLFQHMDTRRASKDNTNWEISLFSAVNMASPFLLSVSNEPVGLFDDSNGLIPGPYSSLPISDPGAASIGTVSLYTTWTTEAGVTAAASTDRLGGSTAGVFTVPDATHGVSLTYGSITAHAGKTVWASIDVGTSASNPVTELLIEIDVSDGVTVVSSVFQTVPVPASGFDPVVISFPLPSNATAISIIVRASGYAAGHNKIKLGNARFSSGRTPLNIP